MTSTVLALLVIWTIVALVWWCCYRLWYWAPTPTVRLVNAAETRRADDSRAA